MEKKLERLFDGLSPEQADEFISSFEAFGESEVSAESRDRILSSVMRKAGFEMKENTNAKARHSKRLIGIIIAATVALTGAIGAGAYAYNQFNNRKSVEMYFDNAEELEKNGYVINQVVENEHLRITVDTVLSDGFNACIITTQEPLDNTGIYYSYNSFFPKFFYADTGEPVDIGGTYSGIYDVDVSKTERSLSLFDLHGVDTEREIRMFFYEVMVDENGMIAGEASVGDISVTIDFSKNCEMKTLTCADGGQIHLSQFELICDNADVTYKSPPFGFYEAYVEYKTGSGDIIRLIRKDGTEESLDWKDIHSISPKDDSGNNPYYITFNKLLDLDEYSGVEIGGVEYLAD